MSASEPGSCDCVPASPSQFRRLGNEGSDGFINILRAELMVRVVRVEEIALPAGAVALSRALTRGATDELLARIGQEAEIFSERLHSPEAKAAFEVFFARKR